MTRAIVSTIPAGIFAAILLLVVGCSTKTTAPPSEEAAIRPIDATGLAQALTDRAGQVVLLEFWATWCAPCLELFPHTVDLHRRFSKRGLTVITVSLDDPANEPAVRKFLIAKGATTANFLSTYGVGSKTFDAFKIEDGALPHVQLYDRHGKLFKTFASGGHAIDPKELEEAVEKLLE
jgi:thiol-disulfide isomerase/thioredoxin